jgi:beta-phosphoglucomutase-like phosphatase (HAD superfamily)
MRIKRVLFDLDGTLMDTQKFHSRAEAEILAVHGVMMSEEDITRWYSGRPTWILFKEQLGCSPEEAQVLATKKWEKLMPMAHEAIPMCDLQQLFQGLKDRGVEISIGTASPVEWATTLLKMGNLEGYLDTACIVGGDSVTHHKPDPETWIKAAQDTPSINCLVVEDGIAGAHAAESAGMECLLLLPRQYRHAIPIQSTSEVLNYI